MKEPAMTISAAAQQNYSHLFPHDVSTLADTDPELWIIESADFKRFSESASLDPRAAYFRRGWPYRSS